MCLMRQIYVNSIFLNVLYGIFTLIFAITKMSQMVHIYLILYTRKDSYGTFALIIFIALISYMVYVNIILYNRISHMEHFLQLLL